MKILYLNIVLTLNVINAIVEDILQIVVQIVLIFEMAIKFIQGNVRSLNTSKSYIEDIGSKNDIKVLCLSEIWHPDFSSLNILSKWKWVATERVEQEGGGAAIIIHPDIKYIYPGKICMMKI